ncbi:MAG: ATP-dependent DNA helicase RecG [Bacilli bacterium]
MNLRALSVEHIRGVGEEMREALENMQLFSVYDVLHHTPYRYEQFDQKAISEVANGETITVTGEVTSVPMNHFQKKGKARTTFTVYVHPVAVQAVCFNQAYLKQRLNIGDELTLTGKWDRFRQRLTVSKIHFNRDQAEGIQAVYSVRGKVTVPWFRRIVTSAFEQYSALISETVPSRLRDQYRLGTKAQALYRLHFPNTPEERAHARRYMAFEEILQFQLGMRVLKSNQQRRQGQTYSRVWDEGSVADFVGALPFALTHAQNEALGFILDDMRATHRMYRLLQGDVGSGKTVVAAIAAYANRLCDMQTAIMVPTEILAEQHAKSLTTMFEPFGVRVALLTSSVKKKVKEATLDALAAGEIDVLVGTHALIQPNVIFRNLTLVIIDEQHRFGVEQRRTLREKGQDPDVLFMTATPIPRTLAITAFGEMDVCEINEMPKGRKPIETYSVTFQYMPRVQAFLRKHMADGRQAYVICPLIEESETLDLQNALDVHAGLVHCFEPDFKVGLLHGRMNASEKEEAMRAFVACETQLLVSTTVVEVGVNVPNANVIVIYDAERFGLSQLHQLRGRVGRGEHQSYCILMAEPKSENGKERMRIMTETTNGFILSERDLELRGAGDWFGTRQSGMPEFKYIDLQKDARMVSTAVQDAERLLKDPNFWTDDDYSALRTYLQEKGLVSSDKMLD